MDKELLLYNYFANSLSKEEEQLFNELLDSDKDFKAQFDFEKDLKHVIKDKENQDLKSKLIGFEKDVQKEAPVTTTKKSYRYLAIAASIVMLVGLAWMGYQDGSSSNYEDLYAANFQEYPNTVFTITRGDTSQSIEREAFAAYELGDFKLAIEKFNEIQLEEKEPYIDFYIAQAYLNSGDYENAKKNLKKTIARTDVFVAESYWYLAMIALKENDKIGAQVELKKLSSDYDYNKVKAREILKELD